MMDNRDGEHLVDPEREPVNLDMEVQRLAKLSPLEYERVRKQEAIRLDIRSSALDQAVKQARAMGPPGVAKQGMPLLVELPEPWDAEVNGSKLIDELATEIRRYIVLPEGADITMALWVVHTHAFECSPITPRLALVSPEKRCGKTTALRMMDMLANKALLASNITAAAMFRTIELCRPTLLVDEADSFLRNNEELRGILNSGHARDGKLLRAVGDDHEVRAFSTWAAAAIASIGDLPATIMDRSIGISMRRKRGNEKVERFPFRITDTFVRLRRQCARWAADHAVRLEEADPDVPASLNDRAADNWRPLLAIADAAAGDIGQRARSAAVKLSGGDDDVSTRTMLLADVRTVLLGHGRHMCSSKELCAGLHGMDERPWSEFSKGKPITPHHLARIMKDFGIRPDQMWDGAATQKNTRGYRLEQFTDAFARYLAEQPARPLERGNCSESPATPSAIDHPAENGKFEADHTSSTLADRDLGADGFTEL